MLITIIHWMLAFCWDSMMVQMELRATLERSWINTMERWSNTRLWWLATSVWQQPHGLCHHHSSQSPNCQWACPECFMVTLCILLHAGVFSCITSGNYQSNKTYWLHLCLFREQPHLPNRIYQSNAFYAMLCSWSALYTHISSLADFLMWHKGEDRNQTISCVIEPAQHGSDLPVCSVFNPPSPLPPSTTHFQEFVWFFVWTESEWL